MRIRRFILLLLLFSLTIIRLKAQMALSAEVLGARPFYFKKADTPGVNEVGVTTKHLQQGFRIGGYYYSDFNNDFCVVAGLRYTHHFSTTDSVAIQVSNSWTNQESSLHGSGKSVFNSLIPQFGLNVKSQKNLLLNYRFTIGMGASWARILYDFPTYDSLTMQYFNPPWYAAGKYNAVRKVVAVRPCMMFNFAVHYEFKYFYVYGDIDYTYSMGDFPPSPVSIGAGILVPLFKKNE